VFSFFSEFTFSFSFHLAMSWHLNLRLGQFAIFLIFAWNWKPCNEGFPINSENIDAWLEMETHGRMVRVERTWGSCKVRESTFSIFLGVLSKTNFDNLNGFDKGETNHNYDHETEKNIHLCVGDLSWFHVFWLRFVIICTVQRSELHLGMEEEALFEKNNDKHLFGL